MDRCKNSEKQKITILVSNYSSKVTLASFQTKTIKMFDSRTAKKAVFKYSNVQNCFLLFPFKTDHCPVHLNFEKKEQVRTNKI